MGLMHKGLIFRPCRVVLMEVPKDREPTITVLVTLIAILGHLRGTYKWAISTVIDWLLSTMNLQVEPPPQRVA